MVGIIIGLMLHTTRNIRLQVKPFTVVGLITGIMLHTTRTVALASGQAVYFRLPCKPQTHPSTWKFSKDCLMEKLDKLYYPFFYSNHHLI